MFARNVHEARQPGTGADENLPETSFPQVLQGRCLADDEVGDELAAEHLDLADNIVDEFVGQAEFGDAVAQHAAERVEGFKHRHRIAFDGQQVGVDEARRAGADDGNRRLVGLRPGVGETGKTCGDAFGVHHLFTLWQEPFELADFDRLLVVRANALALQLLRADAAGDVGQRIAAFHQLHRFTETSVAHQIQHARDVNLHRTAALGLELAGDGHADFAGALFALLVAQHFEPDDEVNLAAGIAQPHVAKVALRHQIEVG